MTPRETVIIVGRLTALQTESRLFQTGSLSVPASRFPRWVAECVRQEVDEAPDLQRQEFASWVDCVNAQFDGPVLRHQLDQSSAIEIITDNESRLQNDAFV